MSATRGHTPANQLGFMFEDEEGVPLPSPADLLQTRLPIPAMSTPTKALARKSAAASTPAISAAASLKEANRLIDEGCLVRYASVQRRMKLRGPINFDAPAPAIANVREFGELIPKFLKKQPPGWVVTTDGFVYSLAARPDAAAIAKAINARSDELGVYLCKKTPEGWQLVFEF